MSCRPTVATVDFLASVASKLRHWAWVLLFWPGWSLASGTGVAPSMFSWWAILRLIAALILVLAIFLALIWLLRRLQPGSAMGASADLRVVATLPLGTRERLLLVQVGTQQLLLGASPAGIHLLHVLEEPLPKDAQSMPGFSGWLRQAMERRGQTPWQTRQAPPTRSDDAAASSPSSAD